MNALHLRPLYITVFLLLMLLALFIQQEDNSSAQGSCPTLEPVITGNDPHRSRNAWPANAQVIVNIVGNGIRDGVNYNFSSNEIQAIRDAFNSWEVQCSGVSFTEFRTGNFDCDDCFSFSGNYVKIAKAILPPNSDGSISVGHTLPAIGLASIDLDYRESRRTDRYGNRFKYRAKVRDAQGANLGRWAWDVFLIPSR